MEYNIIITQEENMAPSKMQPRMFGEDDLPLFSGTAPTGYVDIFVMETIPQTNQDNFITTEANE